MAKITIQKLLKRVQSIQARMALTEIKRCSSSSADFQELLDIVSADLHDTSRRVSAILEEQGLTAADLPVRSRRAYQWVRYLTHRENLITHLDALQRVNLLLPGFRSLFKPRTDLAFYHQGPLYTVTESAGGRQIQVQESLTLAPDRVLQAILETIFSSRRSPARGIVQAYTMDPAYRRSRTRLEYLAVPRGAFAIGQNHDLEASFQRVNRDYFQGSFQPPYLIWSSRLTSRKFGHYQWDIDTVMISRTLDHARVPTYLLDFVMYHELLHKRLGVRQVNGRRQTHTRQFREEESKFARFEQAQEQLRRLAKKRS